MVSCEYFVQLTQARAAHNALQASASVMDMYPSGRDTITMAGTKMKAPTSKPTVVMYCVPVIFWWVSNIATSLGLCRVPKRKRRIACLSSVNPRVDNRVHSLTIIGKECLPVNPVNAMIG
jgi:hypothetical protein